VRCSTDRRQRGAQTQGRGQPLLEALEGRDSGGGFRRHQQVADRLRAPGLAARQPAADQQLHQPRPQATGALESERQEGAAQRLYLVQARHCFATGVGLQPDATDVEGIAIAAQLQAVAVALRAGEIDAQRLPIGLLQ
jgi:hypothetical protein